MTRPLAMLTQAPEYSGVNLAIVAENYCNLSLRLGYHFNVIDAYVSPAPGDNYIYFRFVGGLAEEKKRRRRVARAADILAGLHFRVEVKGDLHRQGRCLPLPSRAILTRLGELVAFTRQLDVRLADDGAVEEFFSRFLEQSREVS
jgi:pyruvate,water dikinase